MRRFDRRFKRPKRPFDVGELKEGKDLQKKYGLRRKKEIWIAKDIVRQFRQRARLLIATKDAVQEKALLAKLAQLGFLSTDAKLDDVLSLTTEHALNRRLQTIVLRKGFVKTPKQARQAIVHGHVQINGRVAPFPSYLVSVEEEAHIVSGFNPPEPAAPEKSAPAAGAEDAASEIDTGAVE